MVIINNLSEFKNLDRNETHLTLKFFNKNVTLPQNITKLNITLSDYNHNKKLPQNLTHLNVCSKCYTRFNIKLPRNLTHLIILTFFKFNIPQNVTHLIIYECSNIKIPQNITYLILMKRYSINNVCTKYKLPQSIIYLTINTDYTAKINLTQNIIKLNFINYSNLQHIKLIIPNNIKNITYGYMRGTKVVAPRIDEYVIMKHNNLSLQIPHLKMSYLKINNKLIISFYYYNNFCYCI